MSYAAGVRVPAATVIEVSTYTCPLHTVTAKCGSGVCAGPPVTSPFPSNVAPWQGHSVAPVVSGAPTVQPRWVQVVENAKSPFAS